MKPIKPMYQRMLCTTIWCRSCIHHRRWGQIAHPSCLRVDQTYNLRHSKPYYWRHFTGCDPQPYVMPCLLRMLFQGWRIHIRWGLGTVRCLPPRSYYFDRLQSQDALHDVHPTWCQRGSSDGERPGAQQDPRAHMTAIPHKLGEWSVYTQSM